jgi:predicted DNA-binding transcriptional regulator AlpA
MEPAVTAKPELPKIPADAEDVALVDATVAAAIGGMRAGWWYGKVRAGEAPQPVIRAPRCTRWRLSDVRGFWRTFAELAAQDTITAALVQSRAAKASARSRELRVAGKAQASVTA